MAREPMPISSLWFQGAMLTYLLGFTVLGLLAYLVYRDQPPMPAKVLAGDRILFNRDDILAGMNVFQRYGLMEYGSVYGHGAYLGPDFTAEYLHKSAEFLVAAHAGVLTGGLSARERVAAELHKNTYDPNEDSLLWTAQRAAAHKPNGLRIRKIFANSRLFLDGPPGPRQRIVPANPTRTQTIGRRSRWRAILLPPMQ
jgi:nitric oxide reductase subunit B